MTDWIKIDPSSSTIWNKKEEDGTFSLDEGDMLVGAFLGVREHVGPNDANLYEFEKLDKSTISVWGSSILDARFKNLKVGEEVKVVYLGKLKSEKTGRQYHNYEVFHKPSEIAEEDIPVIEDVV